MTDPVKPSEGPQEQFPDAPIDIQFRVPVLTEEQAEQLGPATDLAGNSVRLDSTEELRAKVVAADFRQMALDEFKFTVRAYFAPVIWVWKLARAAIRAILGEQP